MAMDAGVQCDGGYLNDGPHTPQVLPTPWLESSPWKPETHRNEACTCSSCGALLPQQISKPTEFRVESSHRRARSARSLLSSASRPQRAYDFTVESPAQRSGQSALLLPVGEQDRWNHESPEADSCLISLEQRISTRDHRVNRHLSQRRLPALISPRYSPSATTVQNALEGYQEGRVEEKKRTQGSPLDPQEPQFRLAKLLTPTVSVKQKHRRKKHPLGLLPFISSTSSEKDKMLERRPGLFDDDYDAADRVKRKEQHTSKNRFMQGAFLPSSAKPIKSPPPMLSRRAQTAATSPKPPRKVPSELGGPLWSSNGFSREPLRKLRKTQGSALQLSDEVQEKGFSEHRSEHRRISRGNTAGTPLSRQATIGSSRLLRRTSNLNPSGGRRRSQNAIPILEKPEHGSLCEATIQKQQEKSKMEALSAQNFKKFADEGKVHKDDMIKILQNLGYADPEKSWVEQVFKSITQYVTIGYDEFMRFVSGYEAMQRKHAREVFHRFDADGSGEIDDVELSQVMSSLGIAPMRHVLEEIITEVDKDLTGTMNFEEFEEVMRLVRRREGFMKSEYDDFTVLFERFDRDGNGTMNTREVAIALNWLGFNFSKEGLINILKEVDEDESGTIDSHEWLRLMRKVREYEVANLQKVVAINDLDGDGMISQHELKNILRCVGYVPDNAALRECAEDAGIHCIDQELDISELWRLLGNYRMREGLSRADLEQVETAFRKYGKGQVVEVDGIDVGKAIREIGYTLTFEMQQNLINKVDIDCSGKLDLREFQKMIRMMHQQDTDLFKMAFVEALGMKVQQHRLSAKAQNLEEAAEKQCNYKFGADHAGQTLTKDKAVEALRKVGCTDSRSALKDMLAADSLDNDAVDFYCFTQAALRSRQKQRAQFRENGGFTKEEVAELWNRFCHYDSDGSGTIDGQEIVHLLEEEFPMLTNDPSRRPQMIQLLKEADEDESGTLDFEDFLRIMRCLRDIQDQLQIGKELEAVSTTKFTPPEVAEFRELFIATGGGEIELGFEQVKELLRCIVPMGTKNEQELQVKFFEFSAKQMGVVGGAELLDFPEFLWLMRELVDMNFAGMNDAANAMVGKNE